jgi:hypothetical protein
MMAAELVPYTGAVLGLAVLWRIGGRKPFVTLRWFVILPAAMIGGMLAAVIPIYLREVASAKLLGGSLDSAGLVGGIVGAGMGAGTMVGLFALLGNALKRHQDAKRR